MLIIYALTYTLMPSLRSETDTLVIYLFSAIYSFSLVVSAKYKVDIFRIFPRNNTHKGFVLPQNDSLQSPSNSKKDQDVFKKALCLFLKALDLFKKRPYL